MRLPRVLVFLLVPLAFLLMSSGRSLGQDDEDPAATATPATTAAPNPTTQPPAANEQPVPFTTTDVKDLAKFILGAAGVLTLLTGLALLIVWFKFYDTLTKLTALTGATPRSEHVPPFVSATFAVDGTGAAGHNIQGPGTAIVGKVQAYALIGPAAAPVSGEWTVDPEDAADLSTTTGETVTVTAKKPGSFKLIAKKADMTAQPPVTHVAMTNVEAVDPPASNDARIPFIGRAYATVLLMPTLLAIAGVLALTGRLTAAAVGLLSAALGFLAGRSGQNDNNP